MIDSPDLLPLTRRALGAAETLVERARQAGEGEEVGEVDHRGFRSGFFLVVGEIPNQVRGGVQGNKLAPAMLDPGFGRDDG